MPQFIDLTGQQFGRLIVQERVGQSSYGQPRWRCLCECGTERTIFGNALRSGATLSCGCLHRERIRTHGATGTPEFTVWQMMRQRCTNPKQNNFASYGKRGIAVCERWQHFENFLSDMGERPSPTHQLERVDNNGNYEPANCRWATPMEQGRNKRNNHILTMGGQSRTVSEWVSHLHIPKATILNRLKRGWSVTEALTRQTAHKHPKLGSSTRHSGQSQQ